MTYDARLNPIYDLLSEHFAIEQTSVDKNSAEYTITWYDAAAQKECQKTIYLNFEDNTLTTGAIIVFEDLLIKDIDGDSDDSYYATDLDSRIDLGQFHSIDEACQLLKDFLSDSLNLNEA